MNDEENDLLPDTKTKAIPQSTVELIYEYLPNLLIDKVPADELAEDLDVPVEQLLKVKDNFLAQIHKGIGDCSLPSIISALSDHVKVRFLIQAFKNTKKIGLLWENAIESTTDVDVIVGKKVKQARRLVEEDADNVSLRTAGEIVTLVDKKNKLVGDLLKQSPLSSEGAKGPSVGININNHSPALPPGGGVVVEGIPEYTGYSAPPAAPQKASESSSNETIVNVSDSSDS